MYLREGVVAAAHSTEPDRNDQGKETYVQSPLECVVWTEMVEGCGVAAQTDHDRGQTSASP